jgi:hypothetical protein
MNNKLLEKMQLAGSIKEASILSESEYFKEKDIIKTELPILNLAFSGKLDGGIVSGLTIVAGHSKCYKTLLCLYALQAYLTTYPDAIGIIYDSEFSITPDYLAMYDIDPNRIIQVPTQNIEDLKFDAVNRLKQLERGDKVFFMLDSLGLLPSKKEVEDAENEKSVADMTRAKAIRSLFRIITPVLTIKEIPFFIVNHIYETMDMFPKPVIGGGTSVMLAANQVFIITRAQETEGEGAKKELLGYKFTINIEKSRFVEEKSKFPFIVNFDEGIYKWSGLFDLAEEMGLITSPKKGFYQFSGDEKQYRRKDLEENDKIWEELVADEDFNDYVTQKYKLKKNDNRKDDSLSTDSQ